MSRATQGRQQERRVIFVYGAVTLWGSASQQIRLTNRFVTLLPLARNTAALQPPSVKQTGLGFPLFARRYSGDTENFLAPGRERPRVKKFHWFLFLQVLRCFTSLGALSRLNAREYPLRDGFPHSEISGSKVAWHLPEAYRSHATSFIALLKSRHPPYALRFS